MSWTSPHFEDIEVLPSPEFGGIPYELVGDEIQRLSVIQNLPNLLKGGDAALCMQRVVPKVMLSLDKASTEFHLTAAPIFCTILEKKLIHPRTYSQTFLLSILSCINNKDPGIASLWVDVLLEIMGLLPLEIIRSEVISLAIAKGQISQPVYSRLISAKILGKASTLLDSVLLKKELLPVILSLCQDVNYEVRACICTQLKFIAKVLDAESAKSMMLPSLVELANDEEVIVRIAAVDTVVEVLPNLQPESKKQIVIPLVKKLCNQSMSNEDDVLCTISFQIGKLCLGIEAYTTVQEKQWLVAYYQEMAHLGTKAGRAVQRFPIPDLSADIVSDRFILCRQNCAYNLPAMFVFTKKLGDAFIEQLYTTFCDLACDSFFMVRRTVACGIHEVVDALGASCGMLKKELVKLLRDECEEVLQGLVPNLGKTLNQFGRAGQMGPENMDAHSVEIGRAILKCELGLSERRDWRLHSMLIRQLESLPRVFSSDFINTYFVPTLFVRVRRSRTVPCREAAGRLLLIFLRYNRSHAQRNDIRNRIVTDLCRGNSCFNRLTFAKLCGTAMELFSRRFFKDNFFVQLVDLSGDAVPNVRLVVARYLPQLKRMLQLPSDKQLLLHLENGLRRLVASEKDRDVKAVLTRSMRLLEKIDVREEAKGGAVSKEDVEDQRKFEEEKRLFAADPEGRRGTAAVKSSGLSPRGAATRPTVAVGSVRRTAPVAMPKQEAISRSVTTIRPQSRTIQPAAPASAPAASKSASQQAFTSLEDEFYVDAGIRIPQQLAASGELPTFSSRIPNLREILFKNRNAKLAGESTNQPYVFPISYTPRVSALSSEMRRELKPPTLLPLPGSRDLSFTSSLSSFSALPSSSSPSSSCNIAVTTCASTSPTNSLEDTADAVAVAVVSGTLCTVSSASPTTVPSAISPTAVTTVASDTSGLLSPTSLQGPTRPMMTLKIHSSPGNCEGLEGESKIPPKRVSLNGVLGQARNEGRNTNVVHRIQVASGVKQNSDDAGSHKSSNLRVRAGQLEQKQSVLNRRHSYMDGEKLNKDGGASGKIEDSVPKKSSLVSGNRRHSYIEKMPGDEASRSSKAIYGARRSYGGATNMRHSYSVMEQSSNNENVKYEVTLRKSLIPSRREIDSGNAEVRNKRRSLTYTTMTRSSFRSNSFTTNSEMSVKCNIAARKEDDSQMKHPHFLSAENKRSHSSLERDDLERLKSPSFGQLRDGTAVQMRRLRSSLEHINSLKLPQELRLDLAVEKHVVNKSPHSEEGVPIENLDTTLKKRNRLSLSKIPRGPASCHSSPGGSRASSPTAPPFGGSSIIRTRQRTAPNSRSTSPTNGGGGGSSGGNIRRPQRLSLGSLSCYMGNLKLSETASRLPVRRQV